MYFACLSSRLFVCLYPINVKTAEPIGPKFSEGPRLTSANFFTLFYNVYKEKKFTVEIEDWLKAP